MINIMRIALIFQLSSMISQDNDQKTPVPNGKEFIEPCFNIGEPNHASSHVDSDSEDNASGEVIILK